VGRKVGFGDDGTFLGTDRVLAPKQRHKSLPLFSRCDELEFT